MQLVIVDARSINQRCRRPPSVRLYSGNGLARLELLPEMHLHVAQADVDNCFHRAGMPSEMQRWFSLSRISAANLGGVRLGDQHFDDNTPTFPLLETLPVGFTWPALHPRSQAILFLTALLEVSRRGRTSFFFFEEQCCCSLHSRWCAMCVRPVHRHQSSSPMLSAWPFHTRRK